MLCTGKSKTKMVDFIYLYIDISRYFQQICICITIIDTNSLLLIIMKVNLNGFFK